MENSDSIRTFWFGANPDDSIVAQQNAKLWWSKNEDADRQIKERFESQVAMAGAGALDGWANSPEGLLALLLLTDQFPRNIYRNTPDAFRFDAQALEWCRTGLSRGMDRKLRPIERVFFYLPLEHAESLEHQALSVQLFTRLYQEVPQEHMDTFRVFLIFALRHRRIIQRFGRFPHRNDILGRSSTPDEISFLQEPASSF